MGHYPSSKTRISGISTLQKGKLREKHQICNIMKQSKRAKVYKNILQISRKNWPESAMTEGKLPQFSNTTSLTPQLHLPYGENLSST